MSKFNAKKFVFRETFTNTNGKQSASGFIGVILGLIAAISFIATMVGYFLKIPNTIEVMEQMLKLIAASTILLGVRKISGQLRKPESEIEKPNENSEQIVDISKK